MSEQRTIEALWRRNCWLEAELERVININATLADQLYKSLRQRGER